MKLTKGFRGKYFSLAAILACSSTVILAQNINSLHSHEMKAVNTLASDKESETDESISLDTILVSAIKDKKSKEFSSSRTLKSSNTSTDLVTVISNEEIELKGFQTLPALLNSVSGIMQTSTGGAGQPTAIYFRGLNSAHTLVLIDGIRVNDITGLNGANTELIDMFNVDRVEIVRGAQGGVWGADASAGVINIITKRPKNGVSSNVGVEFGSNSWQKYSGGFAYANDIFDISLGASYLNTDGISAAAPRKSSPNYGIDTKELDWEKDKFESRTLHLKSGVNINEENRLEFAIRNTKSEIHYDGGAGVDKTDYADNYGPYFNFVRTNFYSLGYIGDFEKNKVNIRANYSTFKRSQYGGYNGDTYEIFASDEFNYYEDDVLVLGAGYQKEKVTKSAGSKLPYDSQDSKNIYASNSNSFGDFIFSQSLRYDIHDKFDNKLTGKVGLRYNMYNDWFVMASYKTGYKTPTLYQQTYGVTANLDAEKVSGYEVTVGNEIFDITYFDTRVKDAIEFDGWYPNDYYYNLKGKSKFKGVELNARYDVLDSLLAEFSYTYLDAKDSNGEKIARRAKHKVAGSLLWFVNNNINMNLRGVYTGSRYDTNNVQTGKYFLADYTFNYLANENINVYFKVQNLFDKYYQEVDGYGTYGRSFYFGVRAGF
ncbi:MAG: TonB-dependent receptor plug domain-containing protein [Campylobacteraceae bacterium]